MKYSAYIPCFNNAATIRQAVESVLRQTEPPQEIMVVDDGSADESAAIAAQTGARVLRQARNFGRGAARAWAMREAQHDLVLCCDAGKSLKPDFVAKVIPWFSEPNVAGVFGRITQPPANGVIARWRGRHLFKLDQTPLVRHRAVFATTGAMARKSAVIAVGNFNPALVHTEDGELGERLLRAGHDIIYEPAAEVVCLGRDNLSRVLERYWRWYAGTGEQASWKGYARLIVYSIKGMAAQDWQAGDPLAVPISLLCPHYQFWRSWCRAWKKKRHGL